MQERGITPQEALADHTSTLDAIIRRAKIADFICPLTHGGIFFNKEKGMYVFDGKIPRPMFPIIYDPSDDGILIPGLLGTLDHGPYRMVTVIGTIFEAQLPLRQTADHALSLITTNGTLSFPQLDIFSEEVREQFIAQHRGELSGFCIDPDAVTHTMGILNPPDIQTQLLSWITDLYRNPQGIQIQDARRILAQYSNPQPNQR